MTSFKPLTREAIEAWKTHHEAGNSASETLRNAELYAWWSDEGQRAPLYAHLKEVFKDRTPFPSRACGGPDAQGHANSPTGHRTAYLLTGEAALKALTDPGTYLNKPYQALGDRPLVLAQDGPRHDASRKRLLKVMRTILPRAEEVELMAAVAVHAACVLPLKAREFDLAPIAREAALRFFVLMWGIPSQAVPLLIPAFDAAYRALNFLLVARHFEPYSQAKGREAKEVVDKVRTQIQLWIDAYRRYRPHEVAIDEDAPDIARQLGVAVRTARQIRSPSATLEDYVPLLARLADLSDPPDDAGIHAAGLEAAQEAGITSPPVEATQPAQDMATMVVEMLGGAIGQIQSCVCHAVRCARRTEAGRTRFGELARAAQAGDAAKAHEALLLLLAEDPPAPILARWASVDGESEGADYLIATASLPRAPSALHTELALARARVFGVLNHRCVGQGIDADKEGPGTPDIALPVVRGLLLKVMNLVGLADQYHPVTRRVLGLRQSWGSVCDAYPLQHDARSMVVQGPLCVRMKVKSPTDQHAAQIKLILQYGAPRIEASLNSTRMVHFAWFQLVENDTTLLLNTVFDGDMASYLRVFANLDFPVFDALFEHLEDAPPTPVKHFQREFVETVMRHHVEPALGFFYSAYPKTIARDVGAAL